jgi:hypothetical protein
MPTKTKRRTWPTWQTWQTSKKQMFFTKMTLCDPSRRRKATNRAPPQFVSAEHRGDASCARVPQAWQVTLRKGHSNPDGKNQEARASAFISVHRRFPAFPWRTLASLAVAFALLHPNNRPDFCAKTTPRLSTQNHVHEGSLRRPAEL